MKPQIDSLSSTVADASGILSSGATQLDSTLGDLKGTSDDASDMLSDARTTLDKVSGKLRSAGAELASFNSTLSDALNSGDMGMVKEVLGNDPETLASTLAAPVQLRRKAVFPVANFGSTLAWPLILIGLLIRSDAAVLLINLGILLFSAAVLFQIVTLPVEFNASRRAVQALEKGGMLYGEEIDGTKAVLRAAALTYVASAASMILQLLRLIIMEGEAG